MAIVIVFGKPDLFLTMTCNPQWEEVVSELEKHQTANDRPDLVVRVFKQKVKAVKKDKVVGKFDAYIYVIEFQKRRLPHMHMLIILSKDYKINELSYHILQKNRHYLRQFQDA